MSNIFYRIEGGTLYRGSINLGDAVEAIESMIDIAATIFINPVAGDSESYRLNGIRREGDWLIVDIESRDGDEAFETAINDRPKFRGITLYVIGDKRGDDGAD